MKDQTKAAVPPVASRESRAAHEAGHAVMYLKMGIKLDRVTIERFTSEYGVHNGAAIPIELERREGEDGLHIALAGIAGEVMLYGRDRLLRRLDTNAKSDVQRIEEHLTSLYDLPEGQSIMSFSLGIIDLFTKHMDEVLDMLEPFHVAVERIASLLLEKGTVAGEDVESIVGPYLAT